MKAFLIVLSAVVFLAGAAEAATFDVTTAAELQTALTAAQNNGQDDLIRVAESNDPYTRTGCFTHTPAATENYGLVIQGGWDATFTYRSTNPENTLLEGYNFNTCRTLTLNASNGSTGDFTVDTLRIWGGFSGGGAGGGLSIIANPPAKVTVYGCQIENNTSSAHAGGLLVASNNNTAHTGGPVVIANNLIRNNTTNGAGGGVYVYSADTLQFYNNLVYGNGALAGGGGLVLVNLQGTAHVANNTITGNDARTAGGGIYLSGGGTGWGNNQAFVFNNIVWGNVILPGGAASDIYNEVSATLPGAANSVTIVNNDFADLESSPEAVTPVAEENIDEPPLFDATDYDSLTKELAAESPCIDRGTNWAPFLPEIDYEGEPRIMDGDKNRSAVVDMGAYEYSVPFTKLTLIVPNGGEVLAAEQTYTLRWADPGGSEQYRLFYSVNGGASWLPIGPGYVTGSSYQWTVPTQTANKPNCRVQVKGYTAEGDPTGTDASNKSFTIEVIQLLSPNGGESIDTGSVATISWAAASNYEKYRLYYSLDNGVTWKAVGGTFAPDRAGADAAPPFVTGESFDWDVPSLKTTAKKVKVKVVGYDVGERKLGFDASDKAFELEVVKVLAPNGGEIWTSGSPQDITWDANETVRSVANVRLQYSLNGGVSWKTIDTAAPADGTYPWTVPAVPSTKKQCRVRVQLLDSRSAVISSDTSDKAFTIQRAP